MSGDSCYRVRLHPWTRAYSGVPRDRLRAADTVRAAPDSLDGDIVADMSTLPELLQKPFVVLTAYNPRSMLLPRKVNEQRHR